MADSATTESEEAPSPPGDEEPEEADAAGAQADAAGDAPAFLEAMSAPIREEAPAGDSVLYEKDFRDLKTQINNIGSVSASVDYERIVMLARSVLTEQSKDLRAAGYLVVGEAWSRGAAGVSEALRGMWVLIDEYWDDLYPEASRMKSRGAALQFVGDRLPDWIEATTYEKEDREALVEAYEALDAIQSFGLDEMGEHAPSYSGLLNELEGVIDDLPEPEPELPEPEPDAETDASDASDGARGATDEAGEERSEADESASAPSGSPSPDASEPPESDEDAEDAIRAVASYYRADDLTRVAPYRLVRAVRWGEIQGEPPNEEGTTRFEAPREQRREYLEGLLRSERHETLVREAESSFQGRTFHVWLDLQRLVVAALDALGDPYRDAKTAVTVDLALFVRRVPNLLSLTFRDGTPFASGLTVEWIEAEIQPLLEGGDASGGGGDGALASIHEDHQEARQALNGGTLERALSVLREGASDDTSKREAFHRKLYAATLCVNAEKPKVARPLLDELSAVVDEHAIDEWHPSLAVEVWTNRCRCYDRLANEAGGEKAEQLRTEADQSFEKLCQTDPVQAVAVEDRR